MQQTDKKMAIDATIKNIHKNFGKGSIIKIGDAKIEAISKLSSGSHLINQALGIGGYPCGRVIEIFGPESSGKTTVALHAIAEAQKDQKVVAFIDAEHALDINYAEKLGVKVHDLLLSQPSSGEEALEIVDLLARSGAIDLIVIDSVAALVPQAEIDGEMIDQTIGLQARLMSKALRKLTSVINHTNTTIIFINQLREKVGIVFGNPETTTGGRALKFYASVRMEIRKKEILKKDNIAYAQKSKIKVVKNKVAPPFVETEIEINYQRGINQMHEIIQLAEKAKIINKNGSWYSFEKEKLGQGINQVAEFLEKNKTMYSKIKSLLLDLI